MKMASEISGNAERVRFLQKHGSSALVEAFRLTYAPPAPWDLPEDWVPKYTPNPYLDQESTLYQSMRKLGKFLVGGYPGLDAEKKKLLFVQLLESVTPDDAILLCSMRKGKLPWRGMGRTIVRDAFPGVLPDKEEDDDR